MADILILDLSNAQAQHLTELIKSGRFVDILDRNDRGFFGVWSIPKKPTIEAGPWLLKGPTCEMQVRVINAPGGGEEAEHTVLDACSKNGVRRVFEDDNQRGRIGRVAREHYDKIKTDDRQY